MSAPDRRLDDARRLLRLRDLRLRAAAAALAAATAARAGTELAVGNARARLSRLERERAAARAALCAHPADEPELRLARVGALVEACRLAEGAVASAEASLREAEAEVREKAAALRRASTRREELAGRHAALVRADLRMREEREADELADMRMRW